MEYIPTDVPAVEKRTGNARCDESGCRRRNCRHCRRGRMWNDDLCHLSRRWRRPRATAASSRNDRGRSWGRWSGRQGRRWRQRTRRCRTDRMIRFGWPSYRQAGQRDSRTKRGHTFGHLEASAVARLITARILVNRYRATFSRKREKNEYFFKKEISLGREEENGKESKK